MPDELKETEMLRDTSRSLPDFQEQGTQYFNSVYGETANPVRELLRDVYPDLGELKAYLFWSDCFR